MRTLTQLTCATIRHPLGAREKSSTALPCCVRFYLNWEMERVGGEP
jgi:hypothetical protein